MGATRKTSRVLWAFCADHRLPKLERVLVEESRVSPCCENGVTNRLAEREFKPPYRWIVIGYRCSRCGQMWVETGISV